MKKIIFILTLTMLLLSCNNNENVNSNEPVKKSTVSEATKPVELAEKTYIQGVDYELLPVPYDKENNEQIVVYEFFGYTCPHCYTFEPFINKWLETKPNYVKLKRVPLNFQPAWAIYQQAYLTAETMGVVQESHSKLFEALHKENKRFNSIDELADWYANEIGVDKETFLSTADSFILDSKMRKSDSLGFKMQITSTPTLVINGKYFASKKVHNRDEVMKIMNFLIAKEAKSMGIIE